MAKVTDIQDKNGVSKEIQDKDLANRTSQSTVASTDYILLEDTDGAYHKIAKASFTEAVRGALGSVINSVAKGTDIAKVPVLDSNNDLGMGTLANLASVLGVGAMKCLKTTISKEAFLHTDGKYYIDTGLTYTKNGKNIYPVAYYSGNRTGWVFKFAAKNIPDIGSHWFLRNDGDDTPSGLFGLDIYYING